MKAKHVRGVLIALAAGLSVSVVSVTAAFAVGRGPVQQTPAATGWFDLVVALTLLGVVTCVIALGKIYSRSRRESVAPQHLSQGTGEQQRAA